MSQREDRFGGGSARAADASAMEEVAARAERLGITPERVLEEYARIAFTSLHDIVEWDDKGMKLKDGADTAAIVEIVAAAGSGRPYRIKLHDKRPFLEAIERHLGMQNEDEQTDNEGEEAQEFLIEELDRLAAEMAEGSEDPGPAQ
jgi:phage terminase small subunit